ncbi:MAG: phosphopantothenoylcysteine decarboxylase [Phycisphaerales bacterium]|nr:phosphopantothenoylcysteine decarboxylase [Phycisphaerales bacterium]
MPNTSRSNAPSTTGAATGQTALRGYEVAVCVTGGIAAYKTASLVSTLVQDGCGITVAMTRNARRFVGPVTFRALTSRPVMTSQWRTGDSSDIVHLRVSETADLIVVAPATANCIGKLAGGIADDLVSSLLLGADCPVMLAPAMNTRMWNHPAVRRNVLFLREAGVLLVGPEDGWLACRTIGAGRMSEPEMIADAVRAQLLKQPPRLSPHPNT